MTKEPQQIVHSWIALDLAAAVKAAGGRLPIDDALIVAAVPCVLVDYGSVSDLKLKYIARAMRDFYRRNPRYRRFTKAAVAEGLRREWLSTLEEEEKRGMLLDFPLVVGVGADGCVICKQELVDAYTKTEHVDNNSYGKQEYTRVETNAGRRLRKLSENLPKHYHHTDPDGYVSVDLTITADEWYAVIKDSSPLIKEFLACYIQVADGKASSLEIERMFGVSNTVIASRNTALGKRAQRLLGFEVFEDSKEEERHYWTTPMLKGRWEGGLFRWQLRPELIEAAKRLAAEEAWELPHLLDS